MAEYDMIDAVFSTPHHCKAMYWIKSVYHQQDAASNVHRILHGLQSACQLCTIANRGEKTRGLNSRVMVWKKPGLPWCGC